MYHRPAASPWTRNLRPMPIIHVHPRQYGRSVGPTLTTDEATLPLRSLDSLRRTSGPGVVRLPGYQPRCPTVCPTMVATSCRQEIRTKERRSQFEGCAGSLIPRADHSRTKSFGCCPNPNTPRASMIPAVCPFIPIAVPLLTTASAIKRQQRGPSYDRAQ